MRYETIDRILNYGIFSIPDYQRGYAWTRDQLTDFIEDLVDVQYLNEHYAGTITLISQQQRERIGIDSFEIFDVVDGQQRLTTIHILLASIYHKLCSLDPTTGRFSKVMEHVRVDDKTILRLNDPDNSHFFKTLLESRTVVNTKPPTHSKTQRNLFQARVYFDEHLSFYRSVEKVLKLYDSLRTKFKVNIFELNSESEVGLIFETMNDRGLPLSDLDKVKNFLIYCAHKLKGLESSDELSTRINKKFGEIFRELNKIESGNTTKIENQFLKHTYSVYQGQSKDLQDIPKLIKALILKTKGQSSIKTLFDQDVSRKTQRINEINKLVDFLTKSAAYYSTVVTQDFELSEVKDSFKLLEALGAYGVDNRFLPLYIAILNSKSFKRSYLVDINQILQLYRLKAHIFSNSRSDKHNSKLHDIAWKIHKEGLTNNSLKKELKDLATKAASSNDFRKAVTMNAVYDTSQIKAVKLILLRYEQFLRSQQGLEKIDILTELSNPELTIEHIGCQNPQSGSDNISEIYVNTIGNLSLTRQNSILNNHSFLSKKKFFASSDLLMEIELVEQEEWSERVVRDRSRRILRLVIEKWLS